MFKNNTIVEMQQQQIDLLVEIALKQGVDKETVANILVTKKWLQFEKAFWPVDGTSQFAQAIKNNCSSSLRTRLVMH